jgi:hypothetical protein
MLKFTAAKKGNALLLVCAADPSAYRPTSDFFLLFLMNGKSRDVSDNPFFQRRENVNSTRKIC